ncbi:hypothetical protein VP01_2570g1 [Puccinia sorghi]|uniref:Uncharacterized protein n=1 Tax=Puccinia sorghi TaxID=27349 RepID=A0A0L6V4X6_9BASI|nr:hypothetical protein VP01_2570g1 [Puccinia sorghi]
MHSTWHQANQAKLVHNLQPTHNIISVYEKFKINNLHVSAMETALVDWNRGYGLYVSCLGRIRTKDAGCVLDQSLMSSLVLEHMDGSGLGKQLLNQDWKGGHIMTGKHLDHVTWSRNMSSSYSCTNRTGMEHRLRGNISFIFEKLANRNNYARKKKERRRKVTREHRGQFLRLHSCWLRVTHIYAAKVKFQRFGCPNIQVQKVYHTGASCLSMKVAKGIQSRHDYSKFPFLIPAQHLINHHFTMSNLLCLGKFIITLFCPTPISFPEFHQPAFLQRGTIQVHIWCYQVSGLIYWQLLLPNF